MLELTHALAQPVQAQGSAYRGASIGDTFGDGNKKG